MEGIKLFADYLLAEIGYAVPDSKYYLLERAMKPYLAVHENYIRLINQACIDQKLRQEIFDAVTINETYFFREPKLWDSIVSDLIPTLQGFTGPGRPLRILSCACSKGQEIWTLAMLLATYYGQLEYAIDAVDLDTEVLAYAERAIYSDLEVNRGLPEEYRMRYFEKVGPNQMRIKDQLRGSVHFSQLNLVASWRLPHRYDIILCRNVLIYFPPDLKRQVVDRLAYHLHGHGYLMLGGCEATVGLSESLTPMKIGAVHALHHAA